MGQFIWLMRMETISFSALVLFTIFKFYNTWASEEFGSICPVMPLQVVNIYLLGYRSNSNSKMSKFMTTSSNSSQIQSQLCLRFQLLQLHYCLDYFMASDVDANPFLLVDFRQLKLLRTWSWVTRSCLRPSNAIAAAGLFSSSSC